MKQMNFHCALIFGENRSEQTGMKLFDMYATSGEGPSKINRYFLLLAAICSSLLNSI